MVCVEAGWRTLKHSMSPQRNRLHRRWWELEKRMDQEMVLRKVFVQWVVCLRQLFVVTRGSELIVITPISLILTPTPQTFYVSLQWVRRGVFFVRYLNVYFLIGCLKSDYGITYSTLLWVTPNCLFLTIWRSIVSPSLPRSGSRKGLTLLTPFNGLKTKGRHFVSRTWSSYKDLVITKTGDLL